MNEAISRHSVQTEQALRHKRDGEIIHQNIRYLAASGHRPTTNASTTRLMGRPTDKHDGCGARWGKRGIQTMTAPYASRLIR